MAKREYAGIGREYPGKRRDKIKSFLLVTVNMTKKDLYQVAVLGQGR